MRNISKQQSVIFS